jgi:uncharacterized membrane protein YjfL (UPF0719 family)
MFSELKPEIVISSLVYAGLGMALFAAAFAVMVKMAPFSLKKEIEEDHNVAVAVIVGSVILGIAHIVASAIAS